MTTADDLRVLRERDEARAALARTDRARRDSENAWEEEYDAMKRERDEARAHTSTAAFMRIEKQRDEARAELEGAKQMARGWEDVYRTEHSLRRETGGKLDETRAEVERLHRLLDHATQTNPGTSTLVMLMNEASEAKAERRQLRRRLVECRPWVGVCPLEPARINEMCLVRDLADDSLAKVPE